MKKIISITFTILSLLMLYSCGPSLKGETKNWTLKQKRIEEYAIQYPAYADFLNDSNVGWKADWEKALAIGEKKEQADALRSVNNSMTLVNLMMSYDRFKSSILDRIEETQSEIIRYKSKYPDLASFEISFKIAAQEGTNALQAAFEMIEKKPASNEEAERIFRGAVDTMQAAYRRVDTEYSKVYDYIRKKEAEEEEKDA